MTCPTTVAAACASALLSAVHLRGQAPVDPYTGGDPAAVVAAGYEGLGRFSWTREHTTRDVQNLLWDQPLCFVETAHFRLALALPVQRMPRQRQQRELLRRELAALDASLPGPAIADARELDPWLQAHLYAARLERMYSTFEDLAGVDDGSFAAAKGGGADRADYMGEGRFLGQPGKFLLLVVGSHHALGRYARNHLGLAPPRRVLRHHLRRDGSLLVALALDAPHEPFADARQLEAAITYHVARNLLDGYRFAWQPPPAWLAEGMAQWFARRACPDVALFAHDPPRLPNETDCGDWRARVVALAARGALPSLASLRGVRDTDALSFLEVLSAWSHVDYLLREQRAALPFFLRAVKAPPAAAPVADPFPSAFGMSAERLDALWTADLAAAPRPQGGP